MKGETRCVHCGRLPPYLTVDGTPGPSCGWVTSTQCARRTYSAEEHPTTLRARALEIDDED